MGGNIGTLYYDAREAERQREAGLKFSRSIPSMFNIVSQCDQLELEDTKAAMTGSNRYFKKWTETLNCSKFKLI